MKIRAYALIFIITLVSGCTGIRFAKAPVNAPIPVAFTQRSTYPSSVTSYEFEQLVGAIISVTPDKGLTRVGQVLASTSEPRAIPIENALNYYHSRIQQGISAKGGYFAFTANMSADSLVDLELDDIARATTEYNDEVILKLNEWVRNHPKPNEVTQRIWVKTAVLTRQTITDYVKISANASGQIGEVTGVQTGVYRKSDNSSRSTIIGFDSYDVDQLVNSFQQNSKQLIPQLEPTRSVESYRGIH